MPNTIGERIRQLRLDNNWLQKELGDKTGFTAQKISNIERGFTTEISSDDIAVFAKVFNVSTDYILRGAETKIRDAIAEDNELLNFFKEISQRDELRLLFSQVKPLKKDTIKRILKYIKLVEDEEAGE